MLRLRQTLLQYISHDISATGTYLRKNLGINGLPYCDQYLASHTLLQLPFNDEADPMQGGVIGAEVTHEADTNVGMRKSPPNLLKDDRNTEPYLTGIRRYNVQ